MLRGIGATLFAEAAAPLSNGRNLARTSCGAIMASSLAALVVLGCSGVPADERAGEPVVLSVMSLNIYGWATMPAAAQDYAVLIEKQNVDVVGIQEGVRVPYRLLCCRSGKATPYPSRLLEALELGVRFQLQTQQRPESVLYLPNPRRASGGIRRSLTDYEIRTYYVQHHISRLLLRRRTLIDSSRRSGGRAPAVMESAHATPSEVVPAPSPPHLRSLPAFRTDREAGAVTRPQPPHHRAHGSVRGGSREALKPPVFI